MQRRDVQPLRLRLRLQDGALLGRDVRVLRFGLRLQGQRQVQLEPVRELRLRLRLSEPQLLERPLQELLPVVGGRVHRAGRYGLAGSSALQHH
jgi:hypothetical protein